MLAHKESVFKRSWPSYQESYLSEEEATYVIQVNGKVRSKIVIAVGASEEQVKEAALKDPKTLEWLKAVTVKKIIVIPGKLVSIVVS